MSIGIIAPAALTDTSITAITLADISQLLHQSCQCLVTLNNTDAEVQIILPNLKPADAQKPTVFSQNAPFPYAHYPNHEYTWTQERSNNQYRLTLTAQSLQGISFGLYALLQEKLGFRFVHPRQSIVPQIGKWPLPDNFVWSGKPLFDKKGFHLHTQHPLELTEQLLDPNMPNALQDVKQYIDWLARNGQNYFEFCLLNSIDKKAWIIHAQHITQYVHERGLLASVDLSLHMIQQKTFQLYKTPINKQKQITKNLQWLNKAHFNFWNMEFSTAEFISGNEEKKEKLRQYIIKWMQQNSPTKLMGRQHVVQFTPKPETTNPQAETDTAAINLDRQRGVLAHTVMFYNMTEPQAPVYQNKNQQHMFRYLLAQHQIRETWYYPESAYWITFDNSVPMLLLPYLKARLADIDTCAAYQIPGHITFSSGWEWGYWLIDWSIARWSWQHTTNGKIEKRLPEMYANQLLPNSNSQQLFTQQLQLQQQYLKDSLLMQWLTAMTITDEIPLKSMANEYHPRPKTSYPYLRNHATQQELEQINTLQLPLIDRFANAALQKATAYKQTLANSTAFSPLNHEIADGLEITALRALHRANILRYLIAIRNAKLQHSKFKDPAYLNQAAAIRQQAQQIVLRREAQYRYPLPLIARKRWDHTAYHFGYLYPVSNLHFWYREEQQAKKNRYSPWFMNIWSVARIIGLVK